MDYNEIFSLVVKYASIILLLSMVAQDYLHLEKMDVKSDFLYGELEEKTLMKQPKGYVFKKKEDHMCLLKRLLYGSKQLIQQWYKRFDSFSSLLILFDANLIHICTLRWSILGQIFSCYSILMTCYLLVKICLI